MASMMRTTITFKCKAAQHVPCLECGADLHAGFHDLVVGMDGPHAHHALLTPTDDTCAVRGPTDGSHCPLVSVMNGVQQLAALRPKSSDFAITPPTDNALPILHHHVMTVALVSASRGCILYNHAVLMYIWTVLWRL